MLFSLPSISIEDIDQMTLLEISKRVEFITEAKKEQQRYFFSDLSSLIFYGVSYGYASTQSKKTNFEKKFHKIINDLLQINKEETNSNDPEDTLKNLFG